MKTFLAVYIGTPAAMSKWNELAEADRAERQEAGVPENPDFTPEKRP